MSRPELSGYYVAFDGSYEDPERQGGLSGPYPTIQAARDWVELLKCVREWGYQDSPKRPLFIIRARIKALQVRLNTFTPTKPGEPK